MFIYIYIYIHIIYIKYFAWEDQREKECYIFHKVARWKIKHSLENTVMKTICVICYCYW